MFTTYKIFLIWLIFSSSPFLFPTFLLFSFICRILTIFPFYPLTLSLLLYCLFMCLTLHSCLLPQSFKTLSIPFYPLGHPERVPAWSSRNRLRLSCRTAVHLPDVFRVIRAHSSVRTDKRGGCRADETSGRFQQGGTGGCRDGCRDWIGVGPGRPVLHDGRHRSYRWGHRCHCERGGRRWRSVWRNYSGNSRRPK